MGLARLKQEIRKHADPAQAKNLMRFFKTGPGEYGEGDRFLGITVPVQRAIARRHRDLPADDAEKLLKSKIHEERLIALMILIERYRRGDDAERDGVIRIYLSNTAHVNNWDLVDLSAPHLLGRHLADRDRGPLYRLARSGEPVGAAHRDHFDAGLHHETAISERPSTSRRFSWPTGTT